MRRRGFITLLGGAAATWPLAARAQQREKMRRVGVLIALEANDAEGQSELKALRQAFQELGWVDGRNLQLEIRWAGSEPDRIQASAKELITLPCEAIIARSTPATAASSNPGGFGCRANQRSEDSLGICCAAYVR